MTFHDKLSYASEQNNSWLCVGLDPDIDHLPHRLSRDIEGIRIFLKRIIEATSSLVCAFKPNIAFFEVFGGQGMELLREIIRFVPDFIPVILDAKRADIGNTSRLYAQAVFNWFGADAVTVNPYLGYDALAPFLEFTDKCTFVLCLTSNPSAQDLQMQKVIWSEKTRMLYEVVAAKALEWNENRNVGLVVGATYPEQLAEIRQLVGDDIPILIPGVGAQAGDLERSFVGGCNRNGEMAIVNISRSILYASSREDFAEAAKDAALAYVSRLRAITI